TSWFTNWLDPQRTPVRLMLFVLMLAGLVLSTSIPEAFGPRGLADELVLAHPTGYIDPRSAAAILGGPALYLVGNILFKQTIYGRMPLSHLVGLLLLASLIPLSMVVSPLMLGAGAALVLVIVAAWEGASLR
ncbi:MAG: low temperature requirement protein A, partial [Woeseiaceae bacterium]